MLWCWRGAARATCERARNGNRETGAGAEGGKARGYNSSVATGAYNTSATAESIGEGQDSCWQQRRGFMKRVLAASKLGPDGIRLGVWWAPERGKHGESCTQRHGTVVDIPTPYSTDASALARPPNKRAWRSLHYASIPDVLYCNAARIPDFPEKRANPVAFDRQSLVDHYLASPYSSVHMGVFSDSLYKVALVHHDGAPACGISGTLTAWGFTYPG